jgi:hypothetical protein
LAFLPQAVVKMASIASWQPRLGRNLQDRFNRFQPGSNALMTQPATPDR